MDSPLFTTLKSHYEAAGLASVSGIWQFDFEILQTIDNGFTIDVVAAAAVQPNIGILPSMVDVHLVVFKMRVAPDCFCFWAPSTATRILDDVLPITPEDLLMHRVAFDSLAPMVGARERVTRRGG